MAIDMNSRTSETTVERRAGMKTSAFVVIVVAVLATTFAAPADAGLVAWWKLDDGSGDTAVDSVGSYDGALVPGSGDPVWTTDTPEDPDSGSALIFDATPAQGVNCGDIEMDAWTDLSVTTWVKTTNGDRLEHRIVNKDQAGVTGNFILMESSHGLDNAWKFQIGDSPGTWYRAIWVTDDPNDGEWHHLVGVVDNAADTVRLYVDGVERASVAWTGATLYDVENEEIAIGSDSDFDNGTEQMFDGSIDDVQIYDHALSAAEITYLFENPGEIAQAAAGPVAEPAGLGLLGLALLGLKKRRS
jgi:concanavalin A-like lectin/glucanase superfamily protein